MYIVLHCLTANDFDPIFKHRRFSRMKEALGLTAESKVLLVRNQQFWFVKISLPKYLRNWKSQNLLAQIFGKLNIPKSFCPNILEIKHLKSLCPNIWEISISKSGSGEIFLWNSGEHRERHRPWGVHGEHLGIDKMNNLIILKIISSDSVLHKSKC